MMIEILILFVFAGFLTGFIGVTISRLFAGDNIFEAVLQALLVGFGSAGVISLCIAAVFGFDYLF